MRGRTLELCLMPLYDIVLHLLEQAGCEDEIVEGFVGCCEDAFFIANPFTMALVDKDDVLADTQHGVHIVGINNGCNAVFLSDIVEEFVDED